jgi:hypothetical protein
LKKAGKLEADRLAGFPNAEEKLMEIKEIA